MKAGLEGKKVALVTVGDAPAAAVDGWRRALEESGAVVETLGGAGAQPAASLDYEALVAIGGAGERTADRAARAPEFPAQVLQLAKELASVEKPIAALGSAVALLVQADVVRGRHVTGPAELREGAEAAGAHWTDGASTCDDRLLTAREATVQDAGALRTMVAQLSGQVEQVAIDRLSEQSFPASDPPPSPTAI